MSDVSGGSNFCEACGTALEADAGFCEECGHPVDAAIVPNSRWPAVHPAVVVGGVVIVIGTVVAGVIAILLVVGVFGDDDAGTSARGQVTGVPFETPAGRTSSRPTATISVPAGFATPEEALGDFYGLAGPMADCDDASLEPGAVLGPGELCASFQGSLGAGTAEYLVGETFSEFFDRAIVAQGEDGSWLVQEVEALALPVSGYETAEEAVYGELFAEDASVTECELGSIELILPCHRLWGTAESGDLIYQFQDDPGNSWWVLIHQLDDGRFVLQDVSFDGRSIEFADEPPF